MRLEARAFNRREFVFADKPAVDDDLDVLDRLALTGDVYGKVCGCGVGCTEVRRGLYGYFRRYKFGGILNGKT